MSVPCLFQPSMSTHTRACLLACEQGPRPHAPALGGVSARATAVLRIPHDVHAAGGMAMRLHHVTRISCHPLAAMLRGHTHNLYIPVMACRFSTHSLYVSLSLSAGIHHACPRMCMCMWLRRWGLEHCGLLELKQGRDALLQSLFPPAPVKPGAGSGATNNLGVVYFLVCLTLGIVVPAMRRSRIL